MIEYPLPPLDQTAMLITWGTVIAALGSMIVVLMTLVRNATGIGRRLLGLGICLSIIVPFLLAFAWSPERIIVTGDRIILESPLASSDIPLDRVSGVRLLRDEDVAGAYRTCGVGGLFGYFGEFKSAALGRFRMFSTLRNPSVLISTADGPIVASPASPESLVAALQSRISSHKP